MFMHEHITPAFLCSRSCNWVFLINLGLIKVGEKCSEDAPRNIQTIDMIVGHHVYCMQHCIIIIYIPNTSSSTVLVLPLHC